MGRFDRYILSHLIRVFGFFALILVGIYWINRAVVLFDRYLADGDSGGLVLQLALLSLPAVLLIVLPVAGFVAAVYATNRLQSESELVVVQATGYSAARLVRPYLIFGLILAALVSILAHVIVPLSFQRLNAVQAQITDTLSSRLVVPGAFQSPVDGVTVYVRDVAPDGTLESPLIRDARADRTTTTYTADRALLVNRNGQPQLVMFDGMAQSFDRSSERLSVTEFEDLTFALDTMAGGGARDDLDAREVSTLRLLAARRALVDVTGDSRAELIQEGHERVTQAILALAVVLVGYGALITGGFSRFGLWRQMVLAVILVVAIKLLDNMVIGIADTAPDRWPFMYLSGAVGLAVAAALIAVADGRVSVQRRRLA